MIGMLGLIVLGLFANILYYENLYKQPIKKDQDIMKGYLQVYRAKYGK